MFLLQSSSDDSYGNLMAESYSYVVRDPPKEPGGLPRTWRDTRASRAELQPLICLPWPAVSSLGFCPRGFEVLRRSDMMCSEYFCWSSMPCGCKCIARLEGGKKKEKRKRKNPCDFPRRKEIVERKTMERSSPPGFANSHRHRPTAYCPCRLTEYFGIYSVP